MHEEVEQVLKLNRGRYPLCLFVTLFAATAVLVGCDSHDHHHHHHVLPAVPTTGVAKGFAFFPFEDELGDYPVYYDTGNELILVTLYDADDIHYEFPLRDFLTDTDGFFKFRNANPGWYFLTAEAQEYDTVLDITDFYWAETEDFRVRAGDIHIWELYLEYDGSEPGFLRSAQTLKELGQLGPGELEWGPELEQFHGLRLERFERKGLQERPLKLRLKTDNEQPQPAAQSD